MLSLSISHFDPQRPLRHFAAFGVRLFNLKYLRCRHRFKYPYLILDLLLRFIIALCRMNKWARDLTHSRVVEWRPITGVASK